MKDETRIFSLEEANALIPELESRISCLIKKKENYACRHDELFMYELLAQAEHHAGLRTDPEGLEEEIHALETSIVEMERDLKEIRKLGCTLRHIDKGWVDFLGRWQSEFVYFCWRRGEKDIRYFHSLKGGMSDRRPLSLRKQKGWPGC